MYKQEEDRKLALALRGNYNFHINNIIYKAWRKVKGVKRSYWGGIGLYLVITLVIGLAVTVFFDVISYLMLPVDILKHSQYSLIKTPEAIQVSGKFALIQFIRSIIEFLIMIFVYFPMSAGIFLIGLRWIKYKEANAYYVFKFFRKKYFIALFTFWLILTIILVPLFIIMSLVFTLASFSQLSIFLKALCITIGILVLMGIIYLLVGFIFALPLIIDRGSLAWPALRNSIKAVSFKWFRIFSLMVLITVVVFLSILPLFIGLIWSLPWAYNVMAEAYDAIFGIVGHDPVSLIKESNTFPQ